MADVTVGVALAGTTPSWARVSVVLVEVLVVVLDFDFVELDFVVEVVFVVVVLVVVAAWADGPAACVARETTGTRSAATTPAAITVRRRFMRSLNRKRTREAGLGAPGGYRAERVRTSRCAVNPMRKAKLRCTRSCACSPPLECRVSRALAQERLHRLAEILGRDRTG